MTPPPVTWRCKGCHRIVAIFQLGFRPGDWLEIKCKCNTMNRWPEPDPAPAAPHPKVREARHLGA